MQCLSPHTMRQGGQNVTVSCGQCMACRVNHAQSWKFRILAELKNSTSAHFITFTYADKYLTRNDLGYATLQKQDLQKFFKRLRRFKERHDAKIIEELPDKYQFVKSNAIRYYACGEYGAEENTLRPHYHAIIFNIPLNILLILNKIWTFGNIQIGTVTPASVGYVTKYITKMDSRDTDQKELTRPFNLMSKGIGKSYCTQENIAYHQLQGNLTSRTTKYREKLPDYLISKVHDLNDPGVKVRLHRQKSYIQFKMEVAKRKNEKELQNNGVDLHQHYEQERKNTIDKLTNTKKRKL